MTPLQKTDHRCLTSQMLKKRFILTTNPVAEVWKSPDIGQVNCKSNDWEQKIQVVVPSYTLRFMWKSCGNNTCFILVVICLLFDNWMLWAIFEIVLTSCHSLKADFDRLLNPQDWISTLMFELNFKFHHWA